MLRSLATAAERGVDDLYAETAAEFLAVHLLTEPDSPAATGQTPRRYLTHLRIEEAKRLLDHGTSVSETAHRCGFTSSAHLSTAFLRETGIRPSAYRRR